MDPGSGTLTTAPRLPCLTTATVYQEVVVYACCFQDTASSERHGTPLTWPAPSLPASRRSTKCCCYNRLAQKARFLAFISPMLLGAGMRRRASPVTVGGSPLFQKAFAALFNEAICSRGVEA